MHRRPRPLLVYDGDCAFCRAWIVRWREATGNRVDYAPSQRVAAELADIPPERFRASVVLVEPEGRTTYGAEAVFRALATAPGHGGGLAAYESLPGFAPLAEASYRFVAAHRNGLHRLTRLLWGDHVSPPGERLTAWVFVRLLAIVYAIAFASLGVQILGLAGHAGILPFASVLAVFEQRMGSARFLLFPTLSWWWRGDAVLTGQCVAGVAGAALLFVGLAPVPLLALLWLLYSSVSSAGQEFLWFQWDSLLLEASLLALFVAPWRWWWSPRAGPRPRPIAVWALRWLAFRLVFSSAVVKLSSGDPTWRSLTALDYHFQTQPLPTWTAWYAQHLPEWFHRVSVVGLFAIEGLVPFLIFLPRRARMLGAWLMGFLMVLIGATGNYGFFNILAVALFVMLLDDAAWPAWLRRGAGVTLAPPVAAGTVGVVAAPAAADEGRARGAWPPGIATPILAMLIVISVVPLAGTFRRPLPWLAPLAAAYEAIEPLHLVGSYGLFAVMTTTRPEIRVQGSTDGVTWRDYDFRWKPGDVRRLPAFVGPHMPRLDWQMWFAALEPQQVQPWFAMFSARLLEGARPVLDLLRTNPFPRSPPRYVRALLENYRFTTPAERRATGAWWARDSIGVYLPPVMLENGRLTVAGGS